MEVQDFWLMGKRRCKVNGTVARKKRWCDMGVLRSVWRCVGRGRFACWLNWSGARRALIGHVGGTERKKKGDKHKSSCFGKWLRNK